MKKLGIINCFEVSKRCSSSGCLRALGDRTASFERYAGVEVQLLSFVHCNGCGETAVEHVAARGARMGDVGVDVIHLSTCMSKCDKYDEFLRVLSAKFEVVGYTHGKKRQLPVPEGPFRVLSERKDGPCFTLRSTTQE